MFPLLHIFLACGASCLSFVLWGLLRRQSGPPLPPGPKGLPFLGNALDIPKAQTWLAFEKWAKIYGPVTYLSILGGPVVVLNTQKAAVDVMEKQSALSSDRPLAVMAAELVGLKHLLGMMRYGTRFRETRKLLTPIFGGRSVERFRDLEEEEICKFLPMLLNEPENFLEHIHWVVGSIMCRIIYGHHVKSKQDPFVQAADRVMQQFAHSTEAGLWMVDFLPILRYIPDWFPGVRFKSIARTYRRDLHNLVEQPFQALKNRSSAGTASPSFVFKYLDERPLNAGENYEDILKWSAASMYSGGFDTSVSALQTFFLAMTLYPEVQRKAQRELDNIIGNEDHLPGLEHRERLPYIDALVKEVLRWGLLAPLCLPHMLSEDIIYDGLLLPRGATVIPNAWMILTDETTYPKPNEFIPERFLASNKEGVQPDPRLTIFGFGRRVCPGSSLANQTMFLILSKVLFTFNISPIEGEPLPSRAYTPDIIRHPLPFRCKITPRTERAKSLIVSSCDIAH